MSPRRPAPEPQTQENPQTAETPETPETPETSPSDGESGVTLASLDQRIDRLAETVSNFIRGQSAGSNGSRSTQAAEAESVAAQVRSELGKIRDSEAADERVTGLEQKVKAIIEQPPREYRRITTLLWGPEDER